MTSASSRNRCRLIEIVGVAVEDLLQRHLAVQLGVQGDEDGPQAAPGVGPQDAEPLAVGGGGADGVARGAVGIVVGLAGGKPGADVSQGLLDFGVADPDEALASRAGGGEDGQAPRGAAPAS